MMNLWKNHGTKIIGFATSLIGALALIDHETLDLIGQVFGPKGGPIVTRGILIISGLATAYRGYENSQPKAPS
jgi:uncharacterized membrane protein YuzA (DUF378 family)